MLRWNQHKTSQWNYQRILLDVEKISSLFRKQYYESQISICCGIFGTLGPTKLWKAIDVGSLADQSVQGWAQFTVEYAKHFGIQKSCAEV